MTHTITFTEKEYQEYVSLKKVVEEQAQWKKDIIESAIRYVKGEFNEKTGEEFCRRSRNGVCDECPIAHIFQYCPLGIPKRFSK
jgi:hypothetical protein